MLLLQRGIAPIQSLAGSVLNCPVEQSTHFIDASQPGINPVLKIGGIYSKVISLAIKTGGILITVEKIYFAL